MKSATELQKEIKKTRQRLSNLESELRWVHYRNVRQVTERERLKRVQAEFRKKYPNETLHPDILSMVGILPHASRNHDKDILRQALADKYG